MEKKKIGFYSTIFFICFFLIIVFFFSTHTLDYAVEQTSVSTTESQSAASSTNEQADENVQSAAADSSTDFSHSLPLTTAQPAITVSSSDTSSLGTIAQPVPEQTVASNSEEPNVESDTEAAEKEFYDQIQKTLDKASASFNGTMAVTYIDLTTGQEISVNGKKEFYTASTIKVPLAMMVADKVNEGVLKWNDTITYKEETDYEEGTGRIINNIQPTYSLQTLQEYNITYSDNIAKNMLYGLFGGNDQAKKQLYRYFFKREANVEDTQFSSSDGADILLKLYKEKETNKEYQKIYDYMKKTVFHERLETALTTGKVAHKIGSYDDDIHDMGILESSHPFILSVFTNGKNGKEAISALTDQLWKLQEDKYPVS
ncbi:serine hydrolase [Enterococcus sp. BWR-S5]|uniref:serine hydrolase n=1 Tax=Enterococcus sp. BWR-S5 TaxID=2787714 RepID=UPI002ED7077B